MAADLVGVGEGKAEREATPAVLSVTALTERHEVREDIRLAPAQEILESHNVMDFKAVFPRVLAATLAALTIALSCSPRLFSPVRAVVRLIATAPGWMSLRIITQPLVPTGSRTEAPYIATVVGPNRCRFALFADERHGWLLPFWMSLALLGCADTFSCRSTSLEARHRLRAIFRCVALPGAEKASVNRAGYLRREQIERFAARLAATGFPALIGAPSTLARTIGLRVALERALPARDDLAARGAGNFSKPVTAFTHATMLPQS